VVGGIGTPVAHTLMYYRGGSDAHEHRKYSTYWERETDSVWYTKEEAVKFINKKEVA